MIESKEQNIEPKTDRREDSIRRTRVRAGKRTYFFEVRATRQGDYFITITEDKRNAEGEGKQPFDRHKIFLYKEDFDKFRTTFVETLDYVRSLDSTDETK